VGGGLRLDRREVSDARWVTVDEIWGLEKFFGGAASFSRTFTAYCQACCCHEKLFEGDRRFFQRVFLFLCLAREVAV
jgi:hypothetical protein